MTRKTFVNLSVANLDATRAFFASLGFEFDPNFSDEKAVCMIVSEYAYVMMLEESFFRSFLPEGTPHASAGSEVMTAITVESRQEADALADAAVVAGGTAVGTMDETGMYSRMIADPDGHLWEFFYMDMAAMGL